MPRPKFTKTTVEELRPPWVYRLQGAAWCAAAGGAGLLCWWLAALANW